MGGEERRSGRDGEEVYPEEQSPLLHHRPIQWFLLHPGPPHEEVNRLELTLIYIRISDVYVYEAIVYLMFPLSFYILFLYLFNVFMV